MQSEKGVGYIVKECIYIYYYVLKEKTPPNEVWEVDILEFRPAIKFSPYRVWNRGNIIRHNVV